MIVHASGVALDGRAVLIRVAPGGGKSSLALQLMALGLTLVADDRTAVAAADGWPIARAPASTKGLIEARGVGILAADTAAAARIVLVVDLDRVETDRLPGDRFADILGVPVPLLHKVDSLHFAAAILQYMKSGRALA